MTRVNAARPFADGGHGKLQAMYIVIAGGGLMGTSLAERLIANKHDVLVIDPDPAVCEFMQVELGAMVHAGSATSPRALEAIGLRRADIAVAMMRNDADNLAFLLLARSHGVPQRLVRMREKDFEQPYLLAGATAIASSVDPLIEQLYNHIEFPEIRSLMRLGKGGIDVFELTIPLEARVAGQTVEQIAQLQGFPPTCNFVAVESPTGAIEVARGQTVVHGGAAVIMLGQEFELDAVIEILTRTT
ncbi:MAG: TrkA-N domain protein [Cyanobacteria bacterium RYN_339]|nr:TrkA-N domain protein [Cyanobacteria bacterium RYN_339]